MAGEKNLTDYDTDGAFIGQDSSDKIGFYGTTPVVQPSSASQAAVTATALGTIDFTSATEAATVVAAVNELKILSNQIRAELVELGLISGAA